MQAITMKLILLLAIGAHASTRHKATKNAVADATPQRLAVEAASAGVGKMRGAVAKLFGRGQRLRGKLAPQPPLRQHRR